MKSAHQVYGHTLLAGLILLSVSAARADNIDDYVHTQMDAKHIPGMAVAVIRDGQVVKESAYGVASVELNVPATLDTSYTLASMSKIFTASAIMVLIQDGKIQLDESITKVLPQLPAKWSHVTIRSCLSHTSGLPDAITDDINITPVAGDRDALFKILGKRPVHPVGEHSAYNQTGYVVLGMIIEKIAGMPYEQFVQTRVLQKAGITDAVFGDGWSVIPGQATQYTALDITKDHIKLAVGPHGPVLLKDKILRYGSKYMPDLMAPAGGLNGSINALIKLEKVFDDGTLVTPENLQRMMTPYRLNGGQEGDFGLGFVTASFGGQYKSVSYGGGAATWRLSYPERKLTVIVLTNLQGASPERMTAHIAAMVDPAVAGDLSK